MNPLLHNFQTIKHILKFKLPKTAKKRETFSKIKVNTINGNSCMIRLLWKVPSTFE